jgi:pyridoxine 5-phosphate synthase
MVELHTGAFANAKSQAAADELQRLKVAAEHAAGLGLQVNAGHGINYVNIREVLTVPHLAELNIGHSIVSRAVFTGLGPAVTDMLTAMNGAPRP